jgi:glycosyltransferase involved in cell wall biosynthesis
MGTDAVCFVSPTAYGFFADGIDAVGGGDRQLSMVSRRLVEEFEVHFVVGDHGQPATEEVDGVTLHRSYKPDPQSSVLSDVGKFFRLGWAMHRADADVYLYCGRPKMAAYLYLITTLLDKRFIYYLANDPNVTDQPDELSTPERRLFERALSKAMIVAQTDKQARLLAERYGVDAPVLPSGYEPVEDTLAHHERDAFIWVGRIRKRQKRPDRFLDLAEQLPDEEFVLIGPRGLNESYCDEIERRADRLANVRYLGRVNEDVLHDYYRRAIALVNTSDYEGFPSTFLEAWRFNTPVVSYAVGVSRFINRDDDPGCAEGDQDVLRKLVSRLVTDVEFRRSLSEPTYEYFRDNLTINSVVEQYRNLLRAV